MRPLRTISGMKNDGKRLVELLTAADYPLGLRREALRSLARRQDGGRQILELASALKLPADLKNDATTLVHTDPNRRIRDQAAKILPLPKTAGGETLPPFAELIRRNGDAQKGKAVFFRSGRTHVRAATAFKARDNGSVPICPRSASSTAAMS